MSIDYSFQVEDDILLVKTTGSDENLEEVQKYGLAIVKKSLENDITRVLVDETELEYKLSTIDTYALAEFLSIQLPRLGKAALVCEEKFLKDAQFFETVVSNRGLQIRAFTSFGKARDWLRNK